MTDFQLQLNAASAALAAADPRLAPVIAACGACQLHERSDYFRRLGESIIGQQLSVKAAAAIEGKVIALFGGTFPDPQMITEATDEHLRSAGLSGAKARYLKDLAARTLSGELELTRLPELSNDEIIAELTTVKGIGEWTAQMFLMSAVGRLDVLATGDLGIRNAVGTLYGFDHVPTPAEVAEVAAANGWHPYESVACWYLWRSLDNAPITTAQ